MSTFIFKPSNGPSYDCLQLTSSNPSFLSHLSIFEEQIKSIDVNEWRRVGKGLYRFASAYEADTVGKEMDGRETGMGMGMGTGVDVVVRQVSSRWPFIADAIAAAEAQQQPSSLPNDLDLSTALGKTLTLALNEPSPNHPFSVASGPLPPLVNISALTSSGDRRPSYMSACLMARSAGSGSAETETDTETAGTETGSEETGVDVEVLERYGISITGDAVGPPPVVDPAALLAQVARRRPDIGATMEQAGIASQQQPPRPSPAWSPPPIPIPVPVPMGVVVVRGPQHGGRPDISLLDVNYHHPPRTTVPVAPATAAAAVRTAPTSRSTGQPPTSIQRPMPPLPNLADVLLVAGSGSGYGRGH